MTQRVFGPDQRGGKWFVYAYLEGQQVEWGPYSSMDFAQGARNALERRLAEEAAAAARPAGAKSGAAEASEVAAAGEADKTKKVAEADKSTEATEAAEATEVAETAETAEATETAEVAEAKTGAPTKRSGKGGRSAKRGGGGGVADDEVGVEGEAGVADGPGSEHVEQQ